MLRPVLLKLLEKLPDIEVRMPNSTPIRQKITITNISSAISLKLYSPLFHRKIIVHPMFLPPTFRSCLSTNRKETGHMLFSLSLPLLGRLYRLAIVSSSSSSRALYTTVSGWYAVAAAQVWATRQLPAIVLRFVGFVLASIRPAPATTLPLWSATTALFPAALILTLCSALHAHLFSVRNSLGARTATASVPTPPFSLHHLTPILYPLPHSTHPPPPTCPRSFTTIPPSWTI